MRAMAPAAAARAHVGDSVRHGAQCLGGARTVLPPRQAASRARRHSKACISMCAAGDGDAPAKAAASTPRGQQRGSRSSPAADGAMAFTDNAAATAQRHADASKSAAAAQPASGMLRVILTGGTKGVGRALARELLWSGDRVLITGRSQASVDEAVATLRAQTGCATDAVVGFAADTCNPAAVVALTQAAPALLGGPVDSWIVNAGKSGGYQSLADASPAALQEVVNTTLFGALLCAQAAQRLFSEQRNGGTLWLTDGAGGAGDSTPQLVAYGACKAALRQAARSIAAEARKASDPPAFAVGMLSPGMCLTDLLLEGASPQSKRAFNALADHPETAAAELVPMLRRAHAAAVAQRSSSAPHLRVLTPPRAALRLAALPLSRNRFFDAAGQPTYAPERERIAKLVARKARELSQLEAGAAAWRKRRTVALAYATCALALLGTYVALG